MKREYTCIYCGKSNYNINEFDIKVLSKQKIESVSYNVCKNCRGTEPKDYKQNSKNKELVESFAEYCSKNPNLRFWQALRNWAKVKFIYISNAKYNVTYPEIKDTFYFEGKSE
jgi:DNA-directed RNA polymerase subunit RPC12/RpoP